MPTRREHGTPRSRELNLVAVTLFIAVGQRQLKQQSLKL
jgi:hypothetical protein